MNEPVDLTAITTPIGLLDEATQAALLAHGGPYEMWNGNHWFILPRPSFDGIDTYRVSPAPVEPPKPREWWIELNPSGSICCTHPARPIETIYSLSKLIHVREVLE